jgi:hypothetical protein
MSRPQAQGATPPTETRTPASAEAKPRVQSSGVTIGKAIEKIAELYVAEESALAMSPAKIRADFASKRAAVLDPLNAIQRKAVDAATAAMRPIDDKAAE